MHPDEAEEYYKTSVQALVEVTCLGDLGRRNLHC